MIFVPVFDKKGNKAIYIQLYEYIKNEITSGILKPDSKLPSIREASASLKLSKTTIQNAYSQLVAEGYIDNSPKRGYFVCNLTEYSFIIKNVNNKNDIINTTENEYINEGVDRESFDINTWKKIYNKVISNDKTDIYNSGSLQGEGMLREEVANFVNLMRGGNTYSEQVIIGAGIQYLIGILIGIIKDDYNTLSIEIPGYKKAEFIFEDYLFKINHIPINENGFSINLLKESNSKLVYISPSHQYPMGTIMPIYKRMELLEWAHINNGLIIEDDYDAIIRYGGKPIPCLQGLDKNDCVIYLGSFSKILLPSLRISFMIIPKKLIPRYEQIKNRYTQSTSKIDQIVLAHFMKEGHLQKHLNKIRRIYQKKNLLLISSLAEKYGDKIKVINSDSGLHIVFEAEINKDIEKLKYASIKYNIFINIVSKKENKTIISLNYSGIDINRISEFTEDLGKILFHK